MPNYKKVNISTVRADPETKERFERIVRELGFSSMAHFFTRSMETLIEQKEAGQNLKWPLRFEQGRSENEKGPPKLKRPRSPLNLR